MSSGRAVYFSPAEFSVMIDLAGEIPCLLLRSSNRPDDAELTKALLSLFQRGMLQRKQDCLIVSGKGQIFFQIRNAPIAVVITRETVSDRKVVCYVMEDELCVVELANTVLTQQYRVQSFGRSELLATLFEAGLLDRPILKENDVSELIAFYSDELKKNPGRTTVLLEKYINGGELLKTYELRTWNGRCLLYNASNTSCDSEIYTEEALLRMLTDCFGKGSYDSC